MNFTTPINESDKELFFGPIETDDTFIIIENKWNMSHILFHSGVFKSVSQARKNGWNKPIPKGFSAITVGKRAKKKDIFIFFEKKT